MASREPRRSHRPRVLHISSDENELMTGLPTSSNGLEAVFPYVHKRRLWKKIPYEPKRQQLRMNSIHEIKRPSPVRAREAVTTDALSTRGQRPTPVRAQEAVTTDELSIRGQRPTKAQPNPVRAHEAVTTDELFTRPDNLIRTSLRTYGDTA